MIFGFIPTIFLFCTLLPCHWAESSFPYPFEVSVVLTDKNETILYPVKVMWDVDYVKSEVHFAIEFGAETPPFYWFAFGLSNHGRWPGTELLLFVKTLDMITDSHVLWNGAIVSDEHQDWLNCRKKRLADGRLVLKFARRFDTRDSSGHNLIEAGTSNLALAVGETMYININGRHVYKTIVPDRLLRDPTAPAPLPQGVQQFIVRNGPVPVPQKQTTYWCTLVQLPKFDKKQHIVKYEAGIESGHEHLVHHMEVYHCDSKYRRMPQYSGECDWVNMPVKIKHCRKVIAAWAMGAKPFIYPEEAGMEFGGPGYFPFVLIETHYNNAHNTKGVVDNSGIRLWYTPQLRRYDAGILEVGLTYSDDMAIPPGMREFDLTGYCISECTDTALQNGQLTIFASQLHAHNSGRRLNTVLMRGGRLDRVVNIDDHYNPHWQEIRHVPPVNFIPGDSLVTTCTYDTQNRPNVTLSGNGISDEMCVNYLHYYPRSKLEVCKSTISRQALHNFFNSINGGVFAGSSTLNYHKMHWTADNIHNLRSLYDKAPIDAECLDHKAQPFPGKWTNMTKTRMRL